MFNIDERDEHGTSGRKMFESHFTNRALYMFCARVFGINRHTSCRLKQLIDVYILGSFLSSLQFEKEYVHINEK